MKEKSKRITYDLSARDKLAKGVNKLADAVSVTLGPAGRNVIIQTEALPIITKDGVTVAKDLYFEDPIENVGAQMVKEVSLRTNKEAGDGTTTATVLAAAILREGYKAIKDGMSPIEVKRTIDDELALIKAALELYTRPIELKSEQLTHVINISSNGDKEITDLISNILNVSNNSEILLESTTSKKSYIDYQEGMSFDSSYVDSFFINSENRTCKFKDPLLFIYDGKIKRISEIKDILDSLLVYKQPVVIIAEEIGQDVFMTLAANKNNGRLDSVVLNAPGFGPGRKEKLNDIAVYTGGEVIRKDTLSSFKVEHLGKLDEIIINESQTLIKKGRGDKEEIKKRVEDLQSTLEKLDEVTKEKVKQRISKFKGGIGTIYIAANSELEYKEKYYRIEDAVNAAKAALEEGIITGGGTTLYTISEDLGHDLNILKEAIKAPYRKIRDNFGTKEYNLDRQECIRQGIFDPKKVTRCALENAVSVVGTILTTDCVITNED